MKIDIRHVAQLANISLKQEDLQKFEKQLEEVLNYVDQLQKISTEDSAKYHAESADVNVLRDDVAGSSLTQKEALSNAKSQYNSLFQVKAIFEDNK